MIYCQMNFRNYSGFRFLETEVKDDKKNFNKNIRKMINIIDLKCMLSQIMNN